jgi:hypothetical protein
MRGVQIKTADEVRVFAHDAKSVTPSDTADLDDVESRGACIYVGDVSGGADIKVTMESGSEVTFKGVTAGSFLPILVTRVHATDTTASEILALY